MKKALIITIAVFIVGMFSLCYGQDVNVNINNNGNINGGGYYINGVSSTQDIGGVEVYFQDGLDDCCHTNLRNYNAFPVTVLLKVQYVPERDCIYHSTKSITYQKVLKANATKEIDCQCCYESDDSTIEGIIVRRLQQ